MKTVDVLWTGGWDSTFRVLDLVLNRGISVVPHYIADFERLSLRDELSAMHCIREIVRKRCNNSATIEKFNIISKDDLDLEEYIKNYSARASSSVGRQYYFIASYVDHCGLKSIEIGVEKGCKAQKYIESEVELLSGDEGDYFALRDDCEDDGKLLFKKMHFPLFHMSKVDMLEAAKKSGFDDIMNHSWFCHRPISGEPCGQCGVCISTIHEGFLFRFPLRGKLRYYKHLVLWKLTSLFGGNK